jgi:hypothetical protein
MYRLKFTLKLLGLAGAAGLCLGATYTWSNNGDDHAWDTPATWVHNLDAPKYPDSASDDPVIPEDPNDPNYPDGWIVDLIDISALGDMTIEGSVVFGDADPNDPNEPTIHPNSLVIDASAGDVVVTISDAAISVPAAK